MAPQDEADEAQLRTTFRHTGARYEVGLAVKPGIEHLPDNSEAPKPLPLNAVSCATRAFFEAYQKVCRKPYETDGQ